MEVYKLFEKLSENGKLKLHSLPKIYFEKQNFCPILCTLFVPQKFCEAVSNVAMTNEEQKIFVTLRNTKLFKDHEIVIKINAILSMVFNSQEISANSAIFY
jgi:hypothetical protein